MLSPEPGLAPQTTPPPPPEHAPPLTEEASMPRQAWPKGAPGSDATCSVPAPQPGTLPGTTVMIADSLFAAGAEDTASVPRTCAQPASTAIQPEITPVRLVAAAGLWATIAADVALRRRGKKRARAGLVVRSARVFPHGSSTDGSTDAAEHAILRPQRRRYRTGTSRSPTRVRWFRRGFILGLSLAFLFAPESAARLRSQLASAGERRHEPNV